MIFGTNTTSDISKLLYVISRAGRRVKFETILKYHEWYLCQISRTNHAIICLYYYLQKVCNFTCRYFKLSWNTTGLSQSNRRNFSCSSRTAKTLSSQARISRSKHVQTAMWTNENKPWNGRYCKKLTLN